ncbi:DUF4344 domain-containing metallopeptidase [Rhizobium wuzhouense]|uniref:Metallopeptidase n=1 Tax=Rhizobium wuzhouense TaxID=1986026 RepID=A0ABX5NMS7_9HYPH|nr:DUF4344 domain-containing metallopeptidase [Rhizobium wuzhouense]PYB71410.1 hypothetical protein DMY87_18895 [Rhizobium wuzhouense]
MRSLKTCCAIGLASVAAFFSTPADRVRAADLTAEQIAEGQKFIVNNALFILFHESGHMLVSELGLPVLGREEDAVDALSSVMLLESEDEELKEAMRDAADGWFLIDEANGDALDDSDFLDTHGLDRQRAYSIVCMMAGADAAYFKTFIDSLDFPAERREECVEEYAKIRDSWFGLLEAHQDEAKKSKFTVTYEPANNADLQPFADLLKESQVLETIEATYGEGYDIPDGIKVTGKTCGTENAFWQEDTREITYCYEMAAYHAALMVNYFSNQNATTANDQSASPEAEANANSVKLKLKE